jgi:glycosyltransferase involved in cell wall biosynthesis
MKFTDLRLKKMISLAIKAIFLFYWLFIYSLRIGKSKNKTKRILFVAIPEIHTVRWLRQISDQNWDIHLFPAMDSGTVHAEMENIVVHYSFYRRRSHKQGIVKAMGIPLVSNALTVLMIELVKKFVPDYRDFQLKWLIGRIKPDIVHSLEFQHAGYLVLTAKQNCRDRFPIWIATNWGSDIYLFGRLHEHKWRIEQILSLCDYYSCECCRDVLLAISFGAKEENILPVFPNTGGFDLQKVAALRQAGATSERRLIMLKGYWGWAYRSLVGLRALERCADILEGYTVVIYLGFNWEIRIAAELFTLNTGIPVTFLPLVSHEEILSYHGRARISIGINISDAISTSFLEALVMGSFPIQTHTSCANEWIEDGRTGILVPPEDPEIIEKAIRRALADDVLVDRAADENWVTAVNRLDERKLKLKTLEFYRQVQP